jgi:DNA-binding NarL/FixJ family response regulator
MNGHEKIPRVVLADDHTMLLDALSRLLQPRFDVVGTYGDGQSLLKGVAEHRPDVVVTDITMPGMDGLAAAAQIAKDLPDARLVFLTMHADAAVAAQAFRAGASAYVVKSAAAAELTRAIEHAIDGKRYMSSAINGGDVDTLLKEAPEPPSDKQLSQREQAVVELLVQGLSMKEVARRLGITPRTVAFHKYKVMQQLGLKTNSDLVRYAQLHGLID